MPAIETIKYGERGFYSTKKTERPVRLEPKINVKQEEVMTQCGKIIVTKRTIVSHGVKYAITPRAIIAPPKARWQSLNTYKDAKKQSALDARRKKAYEIMRPLIDFAQPMTLKQMRETVEKIGDYRKKHGVPISQALIYASLRTLNGRKFVKHVEKRVYVYDLRDVFEEFHSRGFEFAEK